MERDLLTKQIELSALANEGDDKKSVARSTQVQKEVDGLKLQLDELILLWNAEKEELGRAKKIQEKLDQARKELEDARKKGDFAKAGELLHSTIPNLEDELQQLEQGESLDTVKSSKKKKKKMLSDAVSADAIATIIARHTGIPVSRITGSESKKLLTMEDKLREVRMKISFSSFLYNYQTGSFQLLTFFFNIIGGINRELLDRTTLLLQSVIV